MALIPEGRVPRVAVAFMNEDHDEAAAMANHLDELLLESQAEGRAIAGLADTFRAIVDHTREHFAREEEAMQLAGFPAYLVHKMEHDRVLAEMQRVADRFADDGDLKALAHYARKGLPGWFVDHIATMDTLTAQFVSAHQGGTLGGPPLG
ncbi:MAG: bacteriohemerythrin [Planctomycetota bacterium]